MSKQMSFNPKDRVEHEIGLKKHEIVKKTVKNLYKIRRSKFCTVILWS